ncbi:MAG: hypothetical protein ACREOO_03300 [bacterium]
MKRTVPSKIPNFKNDEEIATFMEKYSAFDLIDNGLAEIVPAASIFPRKKNKVLLKNKRVQVAFKDEQALRKAFSTWISSDRTYIVIDGDSSGILLTLSDSPRPKNFYIPYLNISGIRLLDESKSIRVGKPARAS